MWCRERRAGTIARPAQGQPARWVSGSYGPKARADPAGLGCLVWNLLTPMASTPEGIWGWYIGQPVLSRVKSRSFRALQKSAPPCSSLQGRPITRPRTRLREQGTSLRRPQQGKRLGVRVGRSLSKQLCGPMAFFRRRVRANEARGAGLPPRLWAVPAPTPRCGSRWVFSLAVRAGTFSAAMRRVSLFMLRGQASR